MKKWHSIAGREILQPIKNSIFNEIVDEIYSQLPYNLYWDIHNLWEDVEIVTVDPITDNLAFDILELINEKNANLHR